MKFEALGPCKDHDAAARHKLSAAAGEALSRPKEVEPLKVSEDGSYTVQRGDSMWSIARRSLAAQKHATDEQSTYKEVRRLATLNGVDVDKCGSILRIGATVRTTGEPVHVAPKHEGKSTHGPTHGTGGRKPADREAYNAITQPGRWEQSGWVGEVETPPAAQTTAAEEKISGPQPCTQFRPVVLQAGISRAENCTNIFAGARDASVVVRPGADVIINPGVRAYAVGGHVTALDDTTVLAAGGTIIGSPYSRIMPVGDRAVIGIDPSLAAPREEPVEQSPPRPEAAHVVRTSDGTALRTADGNAVRTRTDAEIEAERYTP